MIEMIKIFQIYVLLILIPTGTLSYEQESGENDILSFTLNFHTYFKTPSAIIVRSEYSGVIKNI